MKDIPNINACYNNKVCDMCKDKKIGKWKRLVSSEFNPQLSSQLNFSQDALSIKWVKRTLFSNKYFKTEVAENPDICMEKK